ncbi:TB2_DP1_HVA22 domain-containing protein [Cephalotus follicularis]|uniref:HVA22-like protein n=1 Tax=Cephalotus follicularis TaxID=3775 RepID=A0A1Q3DAT0_CEPFO|nr:TB2_DP1_HVA22 domain-containing protein [Cephalotus follicularis]
MEVKSGFNSPKIVRARFLEVGLRLLLCPLGSNIIVRTACCTVGIGLPVYSTFKAIERNHQNEQQKWLVYWAAYGSFTIVEVFADKLLSWFPLYYHAKFAFLVWLQFPYTDGAKKLYQNHIRPFCLSHQARVDQLLGFAYGEMARLVTKHRAEIQYARTMAMKILGPCHMLSGGAEQDHPQGHNSIEGPRRILDTESVHDD